jgi:glycosyltransferase involved in cell wall biosynthesis
MINDSLGKGGKERRMLELIKGLSRNREYLIRLVSLTDNVEYEYVYDLPIEFVIIKRKWKKDPAVFFKLNRIIKDFNPDIVHSWGTMSSFFLLPAIWLSKKYFINGIIADAPRHLTYFNTTYLRKMITYPFSDVIISNSRAGIEAYKAPAGKTVCIYNGLDFLRFSNLTNPDLIREEFFPGQDQPLFIAGMVAAFENRKDYKTLVAAACALVSAHDNIRFVLVGDGVTLPEIRNSVPAPLHAKIIFTGKRSDIESVVNIFDVGVLLTNAKVHGEGISNSIIEYMALGKPVIATRGGGTSEAVADGRNGYLINPEDPEQLAEKITLLLNDIPLRETLGRYGKEIAREKFDLANMTKQYEAIYHKSLTEKKN